jgi:CheY-like chemotaxis protein
MADKQILIVDDSDDDRLITTAVLRHAGFEVLGAANAEQGFAIEKQERPAVILMDIEMPGPDGFKAIEDLRSDAGVSAIPVIIYTAFDDIHQNELLDLAPRLLVLRKPLTPAKLVETVQKAVGALSG